MKWYKYYIVRVLKGRRIILRSAVGFWGVLLEVTLREEEMKRF